VTPAIDEPGDGASAFADALSSGARHGLPEPAPDPRVAAAFALGWQIAVLYRPERRRRATPAHEDDLPGIGRLDELEFMELGLAQVQVAISKLHDPVAESGLALPDVPAVRAQLREADGATARHTLVRAMHVQLTSSLGAVDFRLGKAYGLARALADSCRNPTTMATLRAEFGEVRIATLVAWLDDLSSAFPAHAGHSVRESLRRWQRWASEPGEHADDAEVWPLLRRQGDLWRALLSGEKLGVDMLEVDNYLDAADRALDQMRSLAARFVRRFPAVAIFSALLFLGGVALIVVGASSASVVAGLGGIIASVGLTWRGIGGSLGRLLGQLERPLWGAALDAAITDAITLTPDAGAHDPSGRRALARSMQDAPRL
jgi:hypothetical protein